MSRSSTSRVGRHSQLVVGIVLGVSFLSTGGAGASEVGSVQGVVEESAATVSATTTQVTQTLIGPVDDTTDEVSEIVTGAGEAIQETTAPVTESVTESAQTVSGTVNVTTEAIVEPAAQAVEEASPAGSQGKTASGAGGPPAGDQGVSSSSASGPDFKRRLAAAEMSVLALGQQTEYAGIRDPCAHGFIPACLLDVLYGVGDTEVLGTFFRNLAITGLALTTLVLGALLAWVGGAGALTWSARLDRGRATPA